MDDLQEDICRVCRTEAQINRPLYHPCNCSGSIKYIHQDCLIEWIRYSQTYGCELCGHRFEFQPFYEPNMPRFLPFHYIVEYLLREVIKIIKLLFKYIVLILAWLGIVPFFAFRTYLYYCRASSITILPSVPFDIFSFERIILDIAGGFVVQVCVLLITFGLLLLHDQMPNRIRPNWLPQELIRFLDQQQMVLRQQAGIQQPVRRQPRRRQPARERQQPERNVRNVQQNNNVRRNINQRNVRNPNVRNMRVRVNRLERRLAARLNWQQFFGFDGSFYFFKKIIYAILLNAVLILIFAFWPYYLGTSLLNICHILDFNARLKYCHIFIVLFIGYCFIASMCSTLRFFAELCGMRNIRWYANFFYLAIKVLLYSITEIVICPILCGFWVNICSLPLFDATMEQRISGYVKEPIPTLFVHWLFGRICFFTLAGFVSLLREVLRPDALWFIQHLSHNNVRPLYEILHLPICHLIRHLALSVMVLGTIILLMIWLPIQYVKAEAPQLIPYKLSLVSAESDLSVQFLLLHVLITIIVEQPAMRKYLKIWLRVCCKFFARVVGLQGYIISPENDPLPIKPKFLLIRSLAFLLLLCLSLAILSTFILCLPIVMVRKALAHIRSNDSPSMWANLMEFFASPIGIYVCCFSSFLFTLILVLIIEGFDAFYGNMRDLIRDFVRSILPFCVCSFFFIIIIFLLGILFELTFLVPLRIPLHQTPINYFFYDWVWGTVAIKFSQIIILKGPDWQLKRAIQRANFDGYLNVSMKFLIFELGIPSIILCGMFLSIPYVVAHSIWPIFFKRTIWQVEIDRLIYPLTFLFLVSIAFVLWLGEKFQEIYIQLKNKKYLLGERLLNHQRNN